jgi:hypothetical protein
MTLETFVTNEAGTTTGLFHVLGTTRVPGTLTIELGGIGTIYECGTDEGTLLYEMTTIDGDDGTVMMIEVGTDDTHDTGTITGELQVDGTVTLGIETDEILITLTVLGSLDGAGWVETIGADLETMLDGISESGTDDGMIVVTAG